MTWLDPPRAEDDVRTVPVDDDVVVFRAKTAAAVNLEGTGSVIWQLIDGATTATELVDQLAEAFGAPRDVVETDVTALLDRLAALGFLATDHATPAASVRPGVLPDPPSP